jgi:hypothetical protein
LLKLQFLSKEPKKRPRKGLNTKNEKDIFEKLTGELRQKLILNYFIKILPWVSILRLNRWLCSGSFLSYFCLGASCGAIMFAVATDTTFSRGLGRQYRPDSVYLN